MFLASLNGVIRPVNPDPKSTKIFVPAWMNRASVSGGIHACSPFATSIVRSP